MPEEPLPMPGDWHDYQYDSFLIREKELNKPTQGTGSVLQQGLEVTQFPDSSIDATSLKAGSLLGDFKVANGSIASRDYKRDGTGWSLNSDGTVDGLQTANYISIIVKQSNATITTGDGVFGVAIPAGMNGKVLTAALARIYTIGTSGTTTIQIRRRRLAVSADMLSTRITVSYNEYYVADGVINTSNDDLATGDEIFVDVDTVASGSPKGLSVVLNFE